MKVKKGTKMNFKQFVEKVTDGVQKFLSSDVEVSVRDVRKNNGVCLKGMTIFGKESNLSPTIYLEPFYEEYENGKTLSDVVKEIVRIYEESKVNQNVNMDFFEDYEVMKKMLCCKLINYEKNKEILDDIPHLRYLDLALVCYCVYSNDFIGNGTIMIGNDYLKTWKVEKEQLLQTALENTEKVLGYQWIEMANMMREMLKVSLRSGRYGGIVIEEELSEEMIEHITDRFIDKMVSESRRGPMYVLTNQSKFLGAVSMLCDKALAEVAEEVDSDLVILPSSVHEVIIVPHVEERDFDILREMVREINGSQVEPQEVLSDNIYFYDRKEHKVTML